jgi:hypothetical protein
MPEIRSAPRYRALIAPKIIQQIQLIKTEESRL